MLLPKNASIKKWRKIQKGAIHPNSKQLSLRQALMLLVYSSIFNNDESAKFDLLFPDTFSRKICYT